MKIKKNILKKKIQKARDYLINKNIIAIDGSGQSEIEELFTVMSYIINNKLIVVENKN